MDTVVVTRRIPQAILDQIAAVASLRVWQEEEIMIPYEVLLSWVPGCVGLYCLLTDCIDEPVLSAAGPDLRVISNMAVGYDNIDVLACTARGIPVGNTPGVLTETTADLTMALLLTTARRVVEAADFVRSGRWRTWSPMGLTGQDVYGSTVGIIGLGRIGSAVAQRLQGFDCRILYYDPTPSSQAKELNAQYVDMDTLIVESDFLLLHCPLTPETHHLVDAEFLAKMKPTAILINTARGPIVDQQALYHALCESRIAAVGLDVTDPEPIALDDPLLSLSNVVVLPHIGSASVATRTRMAQMAADNLLAGLRGERLPFCVNLEIYENRSD